MNSANNNSTDAATSDMDELEEAVEYAKPHVYPSRAELVEQINHANATAIRLRGTVYYDRAHKFLNELLDTIVGL